MQIRFRYNYLKSLYKKFKRELNKSSLFDQDIRFAVKKEMTIVKLSLENSKKIKRKNIEFNLHRKHKHDKRRGFIFAEYNQNRRNNANKELRAISHSVRVFLQDKIAKQRVEKK